jgi:uncharacterized membrane protein (DUF2068 family)
MALLRTGWERRGWGMLMTMTPPGIVKPKRFRPRFHYELLSCGLAGHELIGTDAAHLREEDAIVAREAEDGTRWYRCLRCDSWLPLPPPEHPTAEFPPDRAQVEVPLRGKALRDKVVLRVIAVDRAIHFIVLAAVAVAIFLFAANEQSLRGPFYKILADLQGGIDPARDSGSGILHELRRVFLIQNGTLTKIGLVVSAYALLEGAEAVGLWIGKRWAEYLTFIATAGLLPLEVWELSNKLSPLKIITLLINIAVVVYLLLAKRLFGLRGGAAAEHAERERDSGWPAVERATPGALPVSSG